LNRGAEKTFHPPALRSHPGAVPNAVEKRLLPQRARAAGDPVRERRLLQHPGTAADAVEEGLLL